MSEPVRYDFEQAELNKSAGFYVRKEGHWVRWNDHATALQEIQRLKAEVERLCKAGDALVEEGETMAHEVSWVPCVWDNRVLDWNAAKDGNHV